MASPIGSEAELVSRIRSGEQVAVRELFRIYYSGLCRFAYRFIRSREEVEDIVEGVFEQVWLHRESLDPEQSIKSYLFKAVQNKAIDLLRSSGKRRVDFEEANLRIVSLSDPAQETMDKELAFAVRDAIEKLPTKCKFVFTLSRQDGLTYAEIAGLLGISEKTVENQISRAFRILRKKLEAFI